MKERMSNIELLRVLCILAIISDHFIGQSGIYENSFWCNFFYLPANSMSRVSCSIFIIITAWFSVGKEFKFKKIVSTWFTVIMYTLPITTYLLYIGIARYNDLVIALFPVEKSPLWFAGYYIVLMLASPFLNAVFDRLNENQLRISLIGFFCLLVVYPTILSNNGFFANDIWTFAFIYLFTGYLKLYCPRPGKSKCLIVFFTCWLLLNMIRILSINLIMAGQHVGSMTILGTYGELYRAQLCTLPNLLMAYSAFFFFLDLKIGYSKIVNKAATFTLGIYCFHQVPVFYDYLWGNVYHVYYVTQLFSGIRRIGITIALILLTWILGAVLESIRLYIYDKLLGSRRWLNEMCSEIDSIVAGRTEIQKSRYVKGCMVFFVSLCLIGEALSVKDRMTAYDVINSDGSIRDNHGGFSFVLPNDGKCLRNGDTLLTIHNEGKSVRKLSGGPHPVKVEGSFIDNEGEIIQANAFRDVIKPMGIVVADEALLFNLNLQARDCPNAAGVRLRLIQEGWDSVDLAPPVNIMFSN